MNLEQYLLKHNIRRFSVKGITYYLGCDVIKMLNLKNITNAMDKNSINPRIKRSNWVRDTILSVNPHRSVYLFKYKGIEELIINNNNEICNLLKEHLKVHKKKAIEETRCSLFD